MNDQEEVPEFTTIMVADVMRPADRARAESLAAQFVCMCIDANMRTTAMGAAFALMCFVEPGKVEEILEEGGDEAPIEIAKQGIAQAGDIIHAHETAHRISHLVRGMSMDDIGRITADVAVPERVSRVDALRTLEAHILEERAGT